MDLKSCVKCSNRVNPSFEFFNLITDYAERRPDLQRDETVCFTALDVDRVVINSIGHIFASTAGGVFRSMNDADQWSDVGGGLLPPGGNAWAVATGGFAYAGTFGVRRMLASLFKHSRWSGHARFKASGRVARRCRPTFQNE